MDSSLVPMTSTREPGVMAFVGVVHVGVACSNVSAAPSKAGTRCVDS